jgi:hypothetical protein
MRLRIVRMDPQPSDFPNSMSLALFSDSFWDFGRTVLGIKFGTFQESDENVKPTPVPGNRYHELRGLDHVSFSLGPVSPRGRQINS